MVQVLEPRRARNRARKTAAIRRAALRIVASDGVEALTMQRVAAEADCAVGSLYTYYPSKGALLAEVQIWAIERLAASYAVFRRQSEALLAAAELPASVACLTRVLGFTRWWMAAGDAFPEEARLTHELFTSTRSVLDPGDLARIMPSAMAFLDHTRRDLDGAAAAGAMRSGSGSDRVIVLAAALDGVMQTDRFATIDPTRFDPARLPNALVQDLVRGWGADPAGLAAAADLLDGWADHLTFAPAVPAEMGA